MSLWFCLRGEIHSEFESVKKMWHPCDFASDTPMTLPPSTSVSAHVLTQFIKDSWMSDWRFESHFKCWWSWMKPPHFFYNWNANYYHWQTLHCIVDTYVRLKTCIVYTDNTYLKCYKLNSNYFCFKDVSSEAGGSVSPVNKRRVFSG